MLSIGTCAHLSFSGGFLHGMWSPRIMASSHTRMSAKPRLKREGCPVQGLEADTQQPRSHTLLDSHAM